MAMSHPSSFLPTIVFVFFLVLFYNNGGNSVVEAETKTWCVAKPSTIEKTLIDNVNYACTYVNCDGMQTGGSCFLPDSLISHAAYAMNLYYRTMGANSWDCDFRGSGLVSLTDPSYGSCVFA